MTLTFVKSYEEFSSYRRDDGTMTYLEHGTLMKPWFARYDYDLHNDLWREMDLQIEEFQKFFLTTTIGPWTGATIRLCYDCDRVDVDGRHTSGYWVCESCIDDHYRFCDWCDEWTKFDVTHINDDTVCEPCRDNHASWCEACECYYHDDNSSDHRHGYGCCNSPETEFTIRNDGDPMLANDQRVTVTLPAGVVSAEGLDTIWRYLGEQQQYTARGMVYELQPAWQTREGNFTKRLSRAAYKHDGSKLTPEQMSKVGCIARDHSTPVSHDIEVTRMLNMGPEEFAHEDSCWWQSYSSSRCTLKTNGGFGLRSFNDHGVTGRAWVMPMRLRNGSLTPTFDALTPDAFVVFNGYEDLGGYVPARIMAHMAGMTYRKITFEASPMYINGNQGYLIAPEEVAAPYTDGSLHLSLADHSNLHTNEQREIVHAA